MRQGTPRASLALLALAIITVGVFARATPASARTWLGVYTQSITGDLRDGLGLHGEDGVLVNRVVDGGPADRAGVRRGDVILRLDLRSVESPEALAQLVGGMHDGQSVALHVLRDGERRTLSVTLGSRAGEGGSDEPGTLRAPEPPAAPAPPPVVGDGHDAPRVHVFRGGDAPQAGRDDDGDHRKVRVRIQRDGEAPQDLDLDGGLDRLPGNVREMLRRLPDLHLDGNGGGLRTLAVNGSARGRLGVRIQSLSPDLASALGAPDDAGVLVLEVNDDTPAARAGLRAGDVIESVNGHDVKDAEALVRAIADVEGKATLSVSRKGARRTVEAELEAAPHRQREGLPAPAAPGGDDRPGRLRGMTRMDSDELRQQIDELRKDVRELRQQLQERRHE